MVGRRAHVTDVRGHLSRTRDGTRAVRTFASIRDRPWAEPRERWEAMVQEWEEHWGEGILLRVNAPSIANVPSKLRWCGMLERASASPGSIAALMRANYEMDVRHILPTIAIPVLVMHRTEDALVPVAAGRYLAEHIPNARYVEIPGTDHTVLDADTQDVIADEIEQFITGALHRPEPDRVLTTIVFAYVGKIIGQRRRAGHDGSDQLIKPALEVLHTELASFRGRRLRTFSDGLMATFDGPARAIKFACSAREKVHGLGLQLRAGLHTGECELAGDDISGTAVATAEWITSLTDSDDVLLSSSVRDLVAGSNLQFIDCGTHFFEAAHEWHLFRTRT